MLFDKEDRCGFMTFYNTTTKIHETEEDCALGIIKKAVEHMKAEEEKKTNTSNVNQTILSSTRKSKTISVFLLQQC